MDAVIEAIGVSKQYQMGMVTVPALHGVDFAAGAGEFVAIMGPSGSGKSTLLHLLGGLDQPTGGRVALEGRDLARLDDEALSRLRRRQVGFIFQTFNLLPTLTARENVALPLLMDDGPTLDLAQRVDNLLDQVGLAGRGDHKPGELSGGEQQRVAVARALITTPAVLLADEPTGNLDSEAGATVLSLLHQARTIQGQTVIMVTHDPAAARVADRVVRLQDGRVVHS